MIIASATAPRPLRPVSGRQDCFTLRFKPRAGWTSVAHSDKYGAGKEGAPSGVKIEDEVPLTERGVLPSTTYPFEAKLP